MRRQSKLLYESANILCWFRIIVSVVLALISRASVTFAVLFALAFISDALDGWCYRKFAKERPYQHWFNRLQITMDPIADFFLVGGGIIHVMDDKPRGLVCFVGMAIVMLLWSVVGGRTTGKLYTVLMTGLTYYWFVMMVITVVLVWRHDGGPYWPIGFIVTIVSFYAIWFKTRVKNRTIRRRG